MQKIGEVYRDMQPKTYSFFYVRTFNESITDDLTYGVLYEAYKSVHRFKGNSFIQTWILQWLIIY